MLPCLRGQVNLSPKKWLMSTGLGKPTNSQRESDPKSSWLDTLNWCRNIVI